MRDINRIDPIIKELNTFWKSNQDLRFGQLYYIIGREFDKYAREKKENLFYAEDDKWLELFKRLNEQMKILNEERVNMIDKRTLIEENFYSLKSLKEMEEFLNNHNNGERVKWMKIETPDNVYDFLNSEIREQFIDFIKNQITILKNKLELEGE
jgi:hypothetical protein